ncbi:MAG: hypothetical protein DRG20_07035 [Deltaproteobacteria bacterium]|nr:extracellular solute-binding protein [Deltaproteobacteria bacterium]RLA87810.1 MAG: hypothetical protein DRG20_07035 [Deltaproteobacteria bacterium]
MKRILGFILIMFVAGIFLVPNLPAEMTTNQFMPEKTWPSWMYSYDWNKMVEIAKKEGNLHIIGFGSPDEKAFYLKLAKMFTKKYGIKTTYDHAGWFTAVQTVKDEKDRKVAKGKYDLLFLWGKPFWDLYTYGGVWDAPIVEMVPNARKIPIYPPGIKYYHDMYPTYGTFITPWPWIDVFLFNKKKWKREQLPDTLEGLLDWAKKHPGQAAYCDPQKGGSGHTYMLGVLFALTGGYDKYAYKDFDKYKTELTANWNVLWNWLNKLEPYLYKNNPYPAGNAATIKLFEANEVSLIPMWTTYIRQHIRSGELDPDTVGVYIPKPTIPVPFDGYCVAFNAANKAAALVYLNFVLSEEIQRMVPDAIGTLPVDLNAWYKEAKANPKVTVDAPWFPLKSDWDYRTWIDKGPFWTRHAGVMFEMMKRWEDEVARK